jgi:hypothetical protein
MDFLALATRIGSGGLQQTVEVKMLFDEMANTFYLSGIAQTQALESSFNKRNRLQGIESYR